WSRNSSMRGVRWSRRSSKSAASWMSSASMVHARMSLLSPTGGRRWSCTASAAARAASTRGRRELEADRQPRRTVDVEGPARLPGPVTGEREGCKPTEELGKGDGGLEPRQRRAEAAVDAVPEGDVRVGVAGDVEAIGVREPGRIAVRRADHGEHEHPQI